MESKTQNQRRAVIDVGSNSVKLLVADCAGAAITPLHHAGEQTRLGQGVFASGLLQPEPIALTARAVAEFAVQARRLEAQSIRVLATSAAREARNGGELIAAVRVASGLELDILSADEEARLVLAGVRSTPGLSNSAFVAVDLGGGSAELLVARGEEVFLQQSFALGTVRWLEQMPPADPPTAADWHRAQESIGGFLRENIMPCAVPAIAAAGGVVSLIGAGGTPVFLLRVLVGRSHLSIAELENGRMDFGQIETLTAQLWSMPMAARQRLPGLPANRADVILFGAAIYCVLMQKLGFRELRPTLRGLRYGALLAQ